MKRLMATILALICLFAFVGCSSNPSKSDSGSNHGGTSQGGIKPGDDGVINDDGTLNIPLPETGTDCDVTEETWQALLTEDALRAAMKDNSITTLTSATNANDYQIYLCAGGRFNSVLNGNYRSETICCVESDTVYVYTRSTADGPWKRETSNNTYDEYVSNHYTSGALQYLSGLASLGSRAQYVEAEKAYVIENHVIHIGEDISVNGSLKIQFANEKLYSISLTLTAEGQTATLRTLFGSVAVPEIPTNFTDGSSGNSGSTSNTDNSHREPPQAYCTESAWQRMFSQNRLLDTLAETRAGVELSGSSQDFHYQFDHELTRIVFSANGNYQEIIMNRHERFQRDSQNGQWLHYSEQIREYETILQEKTTVLTQLLTPLQDLYGQTEFDYTNKCFKLSNVSIAHKTFGTATADFTISIQGGRLEKLEATVRAASGDFTLLIKEAKDHKIDFPKDYVDVNTGKEPGKK